MTITNLNSSNNGQTFNLGASIINPETVNVTTTTAVVPTVNVNASMISGSFTVHATAGATVVLDEVVGAAGAFILDANGGTIDASAGVGILASNTVEIQGGGTFIAESSFLTLLNGTAITFGADTTKTDTLVINNGGGLLNLSLAAPIQGFVGSHEVIDDKLIDGHAVSRYAITQLGAGLPQTVTYLNSSGASLGSLTFAAGTFTAGELGNYSAAAGPLQVTVAADGSLDTTFCFLSGTLIRTPDGEVAVENMKPGDLVVTYDGRTVPIAWLGVQTISRDFADPLSTLPIRIKADALGDNVPSRDLLLSPCHAVLIGEVLFQAGALVNGSSIVREMDAPRSFKYYHIETADHSLILAENAPAETFIDNVDRLAFDNWAEYLALYPEPREIEELPYPRAKSHRQVPVPTRAMLMERAVAIGALATVAEAA